MGLLTISMLAVALQQAPTNPIPADDLNPTEEVLGRVIDQSSGGAAGTAPVIGIPTIQAPTQPSIRSKAEIVTGPRIGGNVEIRNNGPIRVRINEMVAVRGQEENIVQGVGLVIGLMGTGDSTDAARQAIIDFLLTHNINLTKQDLASANVALVAVEATLPPGIKPGRLVDVKCSSINDAQSLVGGRLLQAELTDMQGQRVYVTAAGPLTTGAFSAEGDGASVRQNHLTIGIIPRGGKVQREVPTNIISDFGFLHLDLKSAQSSFGNVTKIADQINTLFPDSAVPLDGMTVQIRVPRDLPKRNHIAYINSLLSMEIVPESLARVVINERTGVIVMGEGVRISKGAITKGNLSVIIAENEQVSQPGPVTTGETTSVPRTDLRLEQENRALTIVNGAATLQEVVEVLNVLGVKPRDLIDMLQHMSQAGMLHAEIVAL